MALITGGVTVRHTRDQDRVMTVIGMVLGGLALLLSVLLIVSMTSTAGFLN